MDQYGQELLLIDGDRAAVTSIRRFPNRRVARDGALLLRLPFEPQAYVAVGTDRAWFGHSAEDRVESVGLAGELGPTIVLGGAPQPITRQLESLWKESDLRDAPETYRARIARFHRRVAFPDHEPFFQDLQVDAVERVWVLAYEPPWSKADYEWGVYDSEGRRIASVVVPFAVLGDELRRRRTPTTFNPVLEIGRDYLLVRRRIGYGVAVVAKHRLQTQ